VAARCRKHVDNLVTYRVKYAVVYIRELMFVQV